MLRSMGDATGSTANVSPGGFALWVFVTDQFGLELVIGDAVGFAESPIELLFVT
jgi:hypothetical protein